MPWRADDVPDQSGRTIVVTGANSGLGLESIRVLVRKRAHAILACRDLERGQAARERVLQETPGASIEVMRLDLASLDSIRAFAAALPARCERIDVLMCSAGVMATPRRTTADGFELQFGTNHLGHFALTGLLLPMIRYVPRSRIVAVSSTGERYGRIRFDDLMGERSYDRWRAYGQSKLANVLFAYELQRRLAAARSPTISLAAHPGFAATGLRHELRTTEPSRFQRMLGHVFEGISQSAEMGVLPLLYAATAIGVQGGEYYGPDGFLERTGWPKRLRSSRRSYDAELARRLWDVSAELTGVSYDFGAGITAPA